MSESYRLLARLYVPEAIEPLAIQEAVDSLGVEIGIVTEEAIIAEGVQRLLVSGSITRAFERRSLVEEVLPKTTRPAALVRAFEARLKSLAPTQSLTVIDRFLLPSSSPPDYSAILQSLLSSATAGLKKLVLVTESAPNSTLLSSLSATLRIANPQLAIIHRSDSDFHDRFWIADEVRGIVIGTSLNGIGKRYALLDELSQRDTEAIVDALRSKGIL